MFEDEIKSVVETAPEIKIKLTQIKIDKQNSDSHLVKPLEDLDLDDVLTRELGQFGKFQVRNILLLTIPIILCGAMAEYIFSAATIPHRCRIKECGENENLQEHDPVWIRNAIPETSSGFDSCKRYAPRDAGVNESFEQCPAILFDRTKTIACEDFVYTKDNTVVYEFDLGCKEWLRALAGTLYSIGTLLVLPVTGYISDRFGRRFALVVNIFNLGLFGFLRAFSVNYTMYLTLQIVQTTLGSGAYSSAYIFATELVGPKYRVLTSAIANALFAAGEVVLGAVAWLISPWRYMIMAINIPCFFIVSYYWILNESVRWLLAKKKHADAKDVLEKVAKMNKTSISQKTLDILISPRQSVCAAKMENHGLVKTILGSPILLKRVCTTPVWWITTTFIYYGLSINSVGLSDTMHLNYILTCAIAIPGFFMPVLLLDRFGRRATLSVGYFLSADCNIAFIFISKDMAVLRLIIYLLGKFAISTVGGSMYLYTTELYPTEFRHSLLGFSSMIGRIGGIVAPLTPVLMKYWHGIPSLMFGCMAVIAGLLVLTQPETLGTKLPDNLAEAEAIGKQDTVLPDSNEMKPNLLIETSVKDNDDK